MPINNILVSDVFGSYRVLHRIGEGGMGEVYLAVYTRPAMSALLWSGAAKVAGSVQAVAAGARMPAT